MSIMVIIVRLVATMRSMGDEGADDDVNDDDHEIDDDDKDKHDDIRQAFND